MAAGGPGDHPLTDIIYYKLDTYGPEVDSLIRELAPLLSTRELWEWWEKEIGWKCTPEIALEKTKAKFAFAQKRANESGWEPK